MRKMRTQLELKNLATDISKEIALTSNPEQCFIVKLPTDHEQADTIYRVAYGALLGLNSSAGLGSDIAARAFIDAAENILDQLIPKCNGYVTMYAPLTRILTKWEEGEEITE